MLIDRETVERRIGELAVEIAADYPEAPLVVGILTGAAQFMMALIDRLPEEMLARLTTTSWMFRATRVLKALGKLS